MYICKVCGFDQLRTNCEEFTICPCCGTQFGYDDFKLTHKELREDWILEGMRWFSEAVKPSIDWSPIKQLENLK